MLNHDRMPSQSDYYHDPMEGTQTFHRLNQMANVETLGLNNEREEVRDTSPLRSQRK